VVQQIEAEITVYAEPGMTGEVVFRLESSYEKDGRLVFHSPNHEGFNMIFSLVSGRTELRFLDDPSAAFWISQEGCPREPSQEDEFDPRSVSVDGLRLSVGNRNERVARYYFTLRFRGEDGAVTEWDPIIENKNGGQP
jgi:hypothetical protein